MTLVERVGAYPVASRRVLALSMLVVAVAVFWTLAVEPFRWLIGSQGEWRRETRRELAMLRGKAAAEPQLTQQLQSLDAAPVWKAFYVIKDEADAGAQIGRDLAQIAGSAGISSPTVVPLSKREQADYTGYGVRFSALMSAEQLRKFSSALRESTHFLRIEDLEAQAPQVQTPGQNPTFTVNLEIYGYAPHISVMTPSPAVGNSGRGEK